jgi:hypothetical protein
MTQSSNLKTNLYQVWERFLLANIRSRTKKSDEQLSRESWAEKVNTLESVPKVFRPTVREIIPDGQPFPYSVLTPTFEGYLERENEKLIFCLNHRLFILENDGQKANVTSYRLENINRIEFGEILLKAWINICGTNDTGTHSNSRLRFNSVTDFLFVPFIEAVRHSDQPAIPVDMQREREKFSPLKARHIKFMNYSRKSLLPGERVVQYILQPEIQTAGMKLFGITLFRRSLCMTHMLIQTDHELILIREEETTQRLKDESRYGGIWNYVPLCQVQDLMIEDHTDRLVDLTVLLPRGDHLHLPCANERRSELEQFVHNIKKAINFPIPSLS